MVDDFENSASGLITDDILKSDNTHFDTDYDDDDLDELGDEPSDEALTLPSTCM
jgi:hypothetical protein